MCKIFCNFAPDLEICNHKFEIINIFMENLLKNLGIIILLLGVVCLVAYKFALQENWLLVSSIVLEIAGILTYIFVNKRLD